MAVVANAMEATWQDMEQEAADELVVGEDHDLLPVVAVTAVILVVQGDPVLVEADEAAVRDGDPVGVAGQIGEHRFRSGEGRFSVDDPAFAADRLEMTQKDPAVRESGD